MFGHVTFGANDAPTKSARASASTTPSWLRLDVPCSSSCPRRWPIGEPTHQELFILSPFEGEPAQRGNGVHAAFMVDSRAMVDAFHAIALAHDGDDDRVPGPRPHCRQNDYGACVRDPDGNKLPTVCRCGS